jgi:uncharacterized protein (DUF433 family)
MQQAHMMPIYPIVEERDTERVSTSDPRFGVISIDPERHSGTPCFVGTRVPVQDLWDYLAGGESLETFLENFPTVPREKAVKAIEMAGKKLLEGLPVK